MKTIVKRTLGILASLAIAFGSLTAMAKDEFVHESELAAPESWVKFSDFEPDAWQYTKCGYSVQRNVYVAKSNDAHIIFDAGEGMSYTDAEVKVACTTAGNGWVFFQNDHRKNGVVQVSDDGVEWKNVASTTLDDIGEGTENFKYGTLKFNANNSRYVRINSYAAGYYPNHPIGAWNFIIHGVKLAGEKTRMFESDLTTNEGFYAQKGFELVSWAYARCGYTSARNIFTNNEGSASMIFKADDGMCFNGAEFRVTVHENGLWLINENAHLANRIKYSNDGVNWTNAPDITYVKDENVNYDGATAYWTYTLSAELAKLAKYIKVDFTGASANHVFLHNVKFYGCEEPKDPAFESDLTTNEGFYAKTGFDLVSWAYARCGYASARNIFVNSGSASMTFKADDGMYFNGAEFRVTLHPNGLWLINESAHLANRIKYSNDGVSWTNAPDITYVKDESANYDGATAYWTYTLSAELAKPAKYIKVDFTGAGGYQVFLHNAKIYGGAEVELTAAPVLTKNGNTVMVTGEYKNITGTDDYVFLGVYSGGEFKAAGVQKIDASEGERTISVTADVSDAGEKPEYKLFIWNDKYMPLVNSIPLK